MGVDKIATLPIGESLARRWFCSLSFWKHWCLQTCGPASSLVASFESLIFLGLARDLKARPISKRCFCSTSLWWTSEPLPCQCFLKWGTWEDMKICFSSGNLNNAYLAHAKKTVWARLIKSGRGRGWAGRHLGFWPNLNSCLLKRPRIILVSKLY